MALLGTTLPQFRSSAEPAIEVARQAEAAGLDGVFVFDHLWPLGQPRQPALHALPLLGALVAETDSLVVGTLVARVSVLPDPVLVDALVTVRQLAGERFIAGLGTGDRHNRDENVTHGVPYPAPEARLARLADCCDRLRHAGVTTWVGGLSGDVRRLAAAKADGWNGWGVEPDRFASMAACLRDQAGPAFRLSWGGQVLIGRTASEAAEKLRRHGTRPGLFHGTVADWRQHLDRLTDAGADWVVAAPIDVGAGPGAIELLAP